MVFNLTERQKEGIGCIIYMAEKLLGKTGKTYETSYFERQFFSIQLFGKTGLNRGN